jgi:hypothetical protein
MIVLIDGQAMARGMILGTHNIREFARVPGLRIEDWLASFLSGSRCPEFISKNVRSFGQIAAATAVSEKQLLEPPRVPSASPSGSAQSAHRPGVDFGFGPRCIKSALAAGNDDRADARLLVDDNAPADRTVADDPELRKRRRRDSGKRNGGCKHFEVHGRTPE